VIAAGALNGIAVLRAYFFLFTGARHVSTVSLGIGLRERAAVLSLSVLILGGGLFPQRGVATRQRAAEEILQDRRKRLHLEKPIPYHETVLTPVERPIFQAQSSHAF
jgi:NADH-quinone oxidoreductase subunit M